MDRLICRRRRLRQDRDRGARRVQGDPGRQAGRRPRADDAARPAAPPDLHRALRAVPGDGQAAQPVPVQEGVRRRSSRAWPTAPSTSSSAPTACSRTRSASRTSASSSSTRSSASASSTRSSSSQLRTAVDVLAMSATPIPRTLEMAVTGIREMSTLATPPEERHPVLTYVGAYEEKQITAAIRREMLREGQVFYIHNKVSTIEKAAARIRELVPEARIATAHGKMGEHRLEQVVLDFWENRFDVLVCTTIVETGLDISNANTLIVERADRLGLSQLHQLRGRVGRGRERAYSYFLYPPEAPLTETAHDRLQTIASHTDLGAGMQVAMKDLEIRGAGNLLGGEQSGHIAGVGFDLYVRLVGEAVVELPRRRRRGDRRDQDRAARSTPTCRTTTCRGSGCASRPTRSSRPSPTRPRSTRSRPSSSTATASRRRPSATSSRWPACARSPARPGIKDISVQGTTVRFGPVELRESQELRLQRLYPGSIVKEALGTILVPKPMTARVGGQPLRNREVLEWAGAVIRSVVMDNVGEAARVATLRSPHDSDAPPDDEGTPCEGRQGSHHRSRPRGRARALRLLGHDLRRDGRRRRRARHHRAAGARGDRPDQRRLHARAAAHGGADAHPAHPRALHQRGRGRRRQGAERVGGACGAQGLPRARRPTRRSRSSRPRPASSRSTTPVARRSRQKFAELDMTVSPRYGTFDPAAGRGRRLAAQLDRPPPPSRELTSWGASASSSPARASRRA